MAFHQIFSSLTPNVYLQSVLVLVSFFIASKLVVFVSERILLQLAKKTQTVVDDLIIEHVNGPISLLLLLIGVQLAVMPLTLPDLVVDILGKLIMSFVIITVTYIVVIVFDIIIDNWGRSWASKTKSSIDDHLIGLGHKASRIFFWIVGIILILSHWGFEVGPFIASLGIAGLAVAFALQPTLANIFGGISLILDKTVKVGDVIKLDAETQGTVLDVGLRSTKIRTWDNDVIVVPNAKLVDSQIQNFVQPDVQARIVIPFGVDYGSNVEKVKKTVLKALPAVERYVTEPEPHVKFIEMGDSALLFKAYFYVDSYKVRLSSKDQANTLIYDALNKAKIGIPFPQMDVHVKKK